MTRTSETPRAAQVEKYFEAFRRRDRAFMEDHLAEDFSFTSPYDDALGRAGYFERCWPNGDRLTDFRIERVFAQGDEAFVTYLCTARDGRQFRNTEFFLFAGDRLKAVHVYFGATYRDGAFVPQNA
jgi:ketosteroid isomerase-like protein